MKTKLENETTEEWLNRVFNKTSKWFIKSKRRQKYKSYYNFKFNLMMCVIRLKKRFK